ncbi:MAG: hypothetical protein JNL25_10705 [Rhodospirillaceae bacterium]|nr:hypothetical protein [Rhodospirillaceae bacterium]
MNPPEFNRVVLALDPGGDHEAAIAAAAELAQGLGSGLHVIFLEDESLLDLADLALAPHWELGNLATRSFDRRLMQASFQVQARRAQVWLKEAAGQRGIVATCATGRGGSKPGELGLGPGDLLVLEGASRPLAGKIQFGLRSSSRYGARELSAGSSLLILRRRFAMHGVIGSVVDGGMGGALSIRLAARLASPRDGSLVILRRHQAGGPLDPFMLPDFAASRVRCEQLIAPESGHGIAQRFTELQCELVILSEDLVDAATASVVLAETRCNVMILRQSAKEA